MMLYGISQVIFALCFVREILSKFEETCDRVLIAYKGTQEEEESFGASLGLTFRKKVLSRHEFLLPSSVSFEQFQMSHPELKLEKLTYQKRVKRAVTINDAQWSSQWHLQTSQSPSMNVYNAWDKGFTGSGVTIAIVDDGIDTDHSDLLRNYNSAHSYDIIYDSPDPSHVDPEDGHGTKCGGVAGAVKNTVCVIGVAYEASVAAIRIIDENYRATESDEALALTHGLSNIDIYSNSWGADDNGETFSGLTSIQEEALQTGVTQGRGGKGAIYTWASGNGGSKFDDCNADGYASSIYTIAIAAVSKTTAPTWYSEHCTAILAATYSGEDRDARIATTGPEDTCVNDFTGTSAACPVASGICALTLQANSALTWRDMQHMIVEYSTSSGLNRNANFYTNGAGKQVSHLLGFGLMNAEAMVANAPSWSTVPASTSCSSPQIGVYSSSLGASILCSYTVKQCYISFLEYAVVTISYMASYRGNVEFYLESPSGTRTKLFRSRIYDSSSSDITWDFMSVHTWGENPEGDWTLRMSAAYDVISMNLYYWKIQFYGTVTDPLAGKPAAGNLGGSCTDSADCSGLTDGGCLDDGKVCVVCNNGYRVRNRFCKQDNRLSVSGDETNHCMTSSSECYNNKCDENQAADEENKASLIAGAVIGAVVAVALLMIITYMAYKVVFVAKATATVRPAPAVHPRTVYGTHATYSLSMPPSYSMAGAAAYSNPAV